MALWVEVAAAAADWASSESSAAAVADCSRILVVVQHSCLWWEPCYLGARPFGCGDVNNRPSGLLSLIGVHFLSRLEVEMICKMMRENVPDEAFLLFFCLIIRPTHSIARRKSSIGRRTQTFARVYVFSFLLVPVSQPPDTFCHRALTQLACSRLDYQHVPISHLHIRP